MDIQIIHFSPEECQKNIDVINTFSIKMNKGVDIPDAKFIDVYISLHKNLSAIIGLAVIDIHNEEHILASLCIHSDFRSIGLGGRLLENVVKAYPDIQIGVDNDNGRALKFYLCHNFVPYMYDKKTEMFWLKKVKIGSILT